LQRRRKRPARSPTPAHPAREPRAHAAPPTAPAHHTVPRSDAVRRALAHLAEVERLAQIGSWEWDIVHDRVTWSAELYRILGVGDEVDATLVQALDLVHPEDRARVGETIARARRDRMPYETQHRIVRRSDGAVRVVRSRGMVVCNRSGRPIRMYGTAQDITERQRVEDALAQYVALIVGSEDAIITKTLNGTILSWNPGAERMYGYTAEEIEGHSISVLYPPDRHDDWQAILRHVASGEHVEHHQTVRLRRDGSRLDVSVSVSPVKDAQGNVIGATSIARDVSERRRAAEALAQSEAQLRAFAGRLRSARESERTHIAREIHDQLGQALTALKMDLFSVKQSVPEPLREPLLRKTEQMAELIDQMVDKVRTLAADLRPAVLDNLGLCAAVDWAVRQFAQRTGIEAVLDLPPHDVRIDAERSTDLFRILQEALTNVARHARATRVDVHLRTTPGELVLEVHDNGRGIRDREIDDPRAFGLLGMRERVLPWGGEVGVHAAPQGGTSVTVCMPLGHGRPGAAA
jgi:PAS domain S-box-containing protein